jgi:hypothetical protein
MVQLPHLKCVKEESKQECCLTQRMDAFVSDASQYVPENCFKYKILLAVEHLKVY